MEVIQADWIQASVGHLAGLPRVGAPSVLWYLMQGPMPERLEGRCATLARALGRASLARRQLVVLHACRTAVSASELAEPVVVEALRLLEAGSGEREALRESCAAVGDAWDAVYFDARDAGSAEDVSMRAFWKARAAHAVALALDGPGSIDEAVYEALHAVADIDAMAAMLEHEATGESLGD